VMKMTKTNDTTGRNATVRSMRDPPRVAAR
jgi:hypothetical protein